MRIPWTLQTKTISLTLGIVVTVLAVSSYYSTMEAEKYSVESLRVTAVLVSTQFVNSIRTEEDITDIGLLKKQIRGLVLEKKGISGVTLFLNTPRGREIISASEEGAQAAEGSQEMETRARGETLAVLEQESRSTGTERWWHVTAPVRVSGTISGVFSVRASLKDADMLASRQRKIAAATTLASIAAIVAALMALFRRSILAPVSALIAAMNRAEAGDLEQVVPAGRRDEFGVLANHFNTMLRRIARVNEELEDKVDERTRDLRRANEMLFELQKKHSHSEKLDTVDQVAAAMAHEVGTPLNSIMGHLQLLAEETSLDRESRGRIDLALGQVNRVVGIVRHFQDSSRPESLSSAPTNINAIINELIALISPAMGAKKVTPVVRLASGDPLITVDANKIQQVLLNLMSNALDAMPDGGRLSIGTTGENSSFRITIADTGMGIPREDIKKVFEPFFTTKAEGKGTGLGLAICQHIVKAHGGTIEVDSAPAQGTTFTVTLPVRA